MDEKIREMLDCISQFEKYVNLSEKLFKNNFNISIPPIIAFRRERLFPKSGVLKNGTDIVTYNFHGKGVELNFSGIIVDFDYESPDFDYKGFDVWKLHQFVLSHENKFLSIKSEESFYSTIKNMDENGIISKDNPPFNSYSVGSYI